MKKKSSHRIDRRKLNRKRSGGSMQRVVRALAKTIWRAALEEVRKDEGYDDGVNDYRKIDPRTKSAMNGIAKWILKHKRPNDQGG